MKKSTGGKVQQMFVDLLMREGSVELVLPNGMVLEVGITQENRYGDLEKVPDYCWVVASHKHRSISIDNYNLGIRYTGDKEMVCEYSMQSEDGVNINILDLV
jgi:hypothetical protein